MSLIEVEGLPGPPWERPLAGALDRLVVQSEVLAGNPLGDPTRRPLYVYRPPGVSAGDTGELPSVYVIQGYTGQVDMWLGRSAFEPTFVERLDELFADQACQPAVVVLVDAWTSLGGSQFLNSSSTGRYLDHLCDEIVPFIDARYPTGADCSHRGIAGKSSGGYGAMVAPMLRPDVFGALATHAGDALFELSLWKDVPTVVRTLRDHYEGSYQQYLQSLRSRPHLDGPDDHALVMMWAMAAAYSTDADGTVHLPFDVATGLMVDEVWQRWLAWDPVRMVPGHADALRSLRAIYIDAGTRDEFFLDLAAMAFRDALAAVGVGDVRFELFPAGHGAIEYRYPIAMRYLAERMSSGG